MTTQTGAGRGVPEYRESDDPCNNAQGEPLGPWVRRRSEPSQEAPMSEPVDDGFAVGEAICNACRHTWVAIVPKKDDPMADLECPKCGAMSSEEKREVGL